MSKLIKMVRESDGKCADVHPDMVEEYRAAGFEPFVRADPLDHDFDGEKGGSLSGKASTAAKGARRRKGKAK